MAEGDGRADGRPREAPMTAGQLRWNFWWMGTWFALNHGVVTTPLVVVSTVFKKEVAVANVGNGILYVFTVLSSLFLGAPFVSSFGPKNGLLFGMLFYCVYVGCFSIAAYFTDIHDVPALRWLTFVGGSAAGGVAAGVLWTAQGGYFAASATKIAEAEGVAREVVTASLAGNFAFVYLGFEVISKMGFTGLQKLPIPHGLAQLLGSGDDDRLPIHIIGGIYLALGILACVAMLGVHRFPPPPSAAKPLSKVLATISLWSDPIIWLLSPTNLTFGFCAAFMNGYVNATYTAKELGDEWVAFMGAITAAAASLLSRGFGPLAGLVGKGPVLALGAACFFSIPVLLYPAGCCSGWGWWMLSLYLLQGSGRAIYESTNRAMFSDFFPGPKTEGAFANCMLQASLSFAACFFLQSALKGGVLAVVVVVLACLTPICFIAARLIVRRRQAAANAAAATPLNMEAARQEHKGN